MVLQAFIDESLGTDGTFVMAGYVSTAERWAYFASEWKAMLPFSTRDKHDLFNFKMSSMAMNPERMDRVRAFYRIIEQHAMLALSCKIDLHDLDKARSRLSLSHGKIMFSKSFNHYQVACRFLLDGFHSFRFKNGMQDLFPLDQKVDFIFDDYADKSVIIRAWEEYVQARSPAFRSLYGQTPRFESDSDFLPLQAADFWAWWVRKRYSEGDYAKSFDLDFGKWTGDLSKYPILLITVSEDDIANKIKSMIAEQLEAGSFVYDSKYNSAFYQI